MPKITITTEDGELIETFSTGDYDISKPFAKAMLVEEIMEAVRRASLIEKKEKP